MASRKKVIVRRFSPGHLSGYVQDGNLREGGGADSLGLLDLSANVQLVPIDDVKYVAFVREFNPAEAEPERLVRKTFLNRPRNEGLWLRLTLRDGDLLEGLAPLDLGFADGWTVDGGVTLTPPDIRGNTQRLFVPRTAIERMEFVGVVTTPARKQRVIAAVDDPQPDLFSQVAAPDVSPN